jgi:spore coat protein U-like protein
MGTVGRIFFITSIVLWAFECSAFNCSVSTTPIAFSYDVFNTFRTDSTGSITVNCNNPEKKPIAIMIAISTGGSGIFTPRQMKTVTGTDSLNYNLYTDPSRATIWGDGTGASATVNSVVTRDTTLSPIIYASIPPLQNVRVGNYSDLLVVTVSW